MVIDPSKAPIGLANLLTVAADGGHRSVCSAVTSQGCLGWGSQICGGKCQEAHMAAEFGKNLLEENQTGPGPVPVVGKVINLPN